MVLANSSVYGPVKSWRFGQSLGIDPIGAISTCSFNCVYCQLGNIQQQTKKRQVFVPTEQIFSELSEVSPRAIATADVVTLSGSGEPTLALNLAEILIMARQITAKPVVVLTNGTLLPDLQVQAALLEADRIAIKLDAISLENLRRINRPVAGFNWPEIWQAWQTFCQQYQGQLAVQTMLLTPWDDSTQFEYICLLKRLRPAEIQLNTPIRPKAVQRILEARGNYSPHTQPYEAVFLKPIDLISLKTFGDRIFEQTGIPVRYPIF
ncbi:radical SAM protein [bacterium]|nr:radical SAM protein [bacterium]